MNRRLVAYGVVTALVLLPNVLAAFGYLRGAPELAEGIRRLGYPAYLMVWLGALKLAGAVAIVWRRIPKLTEWAYAGYGFVLTGAAYSHLAAGDPAGLAVPPLVMLGFLVASYQLRPRPRDAAGTAVGATSSPAAA